MRSNIFTPTLLAICAAGLTAASPVLAQAQDQQRKRQPAWPCAGTVDAAHVRTAEATGGVVMLLKPAEIAGAAAESSASMRHDQVVFRGSGEFADGAHEFEIALDSTIESAYIFASIQCLEDVTIVGPAGDVVRSDRAGLEYHAFEAMRLFTIREPAPGLWRVRLTGRGFLTLIVKARSTLRLTGVSFADAGIGLTREPKPQRLGITVTGTAGPLAFEFVSQAAETIAPLDLTLETETETQRTYGGEVTPPTAAFRMSVTGLDPQGFRFQRVQKQLVVTER